MPRLWLFSAAYREPTGTNWLGEVLIEIGVQPFEGRAIEAVGNHIGEAGLSQILCKHRNAVQIEQNLFKAEVAQAAAALFSK